MYDWLHTYIGSGIWNGELLYLLMYLRERDKEILKHMGDFVHAWTYPRCVAAPTHNVVGEVDFQNDDHVEWDGTEALNIFRLVAV